jgi:hypothetical protein
MLRIAHHWHSTENGFLCFTWPPCGGLYSGRPNGDPNFLCGLEDLVDFISEKGSASLYYLRGFKRLRGVLKTFMAECAIVSRVTEGAMISLLEDPRVCSTYQQLWQAVSEEMLWVIGLPMPVWTILSGVAETTAIELRSSCIAAAHASMHFFWRRVLQPAGQRPWS